MGKETGIGWCHHTWSPWHGCSKVSAGCANCYAEAGSKRNPGVLGVWGPAGTRVVSKSWDRPRKWDREARAAGQRRRIFPSLCDPFEDREDLVNPRIRFFDLVAGTPYLDWLILTKRPDHARVWLEGSRLQGLWPLPNAWLGVSAEDQARADERIPVLLDVPAAVRFVSCEPLLGPVDLSPYLRCPECLGHAWDRIDGHAVPCPVCHGDSRGLDWVIVGGESGPRRRPMELTWLEAIVGRCWSSVVPCYVKQDAALRDGQQGRIPDDLWATREFPATITD